MIAALYVQADGIYSRFQDIEIWDEERDARDYAGPWPVVAHPPCERWGRFWHGSPRKPFQYERGDDGGCFAAALFAVRLWGGILEHPAYSSAWQAHGLPYPLGRGWQRDIDGGWCCYVEQGWYGYNGRKATWLYGVDIAPPALRWGKGEQRLDPDIVARFGYKKAMRYGATSLIGGKDKKKRRDATPPEFAALLLSIAATVAPTPYIYRETR